MGLFTKPIMTTPFITNEEFTSLVPGLDVSQYSSATISGMLAQATRIVEKYLDYSLAFEAGKVEKVRGIVDNFNDIQVWPTKMPLRALNSVAIVKGTFSSNLTLSNNNQETFDIVDERYAVISSSQVALQSVSIINYSTLRRVPFYLEVNYDAGYYMYDRPEDIMFVVAQVARNMFVGNINVTGASELSQGAVTIKYAKTTTHNGSQYLTTDLMGLLEDYRTMVR